MTKVLDTPALPVQLKPRFEKLRDAYKEGKDGRGEKKPAAAAKPAVTPEKESEKK